MGAGFFPLRSICHAGGRQADGTGRAAAFAALMAVDAGQGAVSLEHRFECLPLPRP
jgi:hypothetical protein